MGSNVYHSMGSNVCGVKERESHGDKNRPAMREGEKLSDTRASHLESYSIASPDIIIMMMIA